MAKKEYVPQIGDRVRVKSKFACSPYLEGATGTVVLLSPSHSVATSVGVCFDEPFEGGHNFFGYDGYPWRDRRCRWGAAKELTFLRERLGSARVRRLRGPHTGHGSGTDNPTSGPVIPVGTYNARNFTARGFIVGCTRVSWATAEKIMKLRPKKKKAKVTK